MVDRAPASPWILCAARTKRPAAAQGREHRHQHPLADQLVAELLPIGAVEPADVGLGAVLGGGEHARRERHAGAFRTYWSCATVAW
jgi:hypothetical protein